MKRMLPGLLVGWVLLGGARAEGAVEAAQSRMEYCFLSRQSCDWTLHLDLGLGYGQASGAADRKLTQVFGDLGALGAVGPSLQLGATVAVGGDLYSEGAGRYSITPRFRARFWPVEEIGVDWGLGATILPKFHEEPLAFGPNLEIGLNLRAISLFASGDVIVQPGRASEYRVVGGIKLTVPVWGGIAYVAGAIAGGH